MTDRGAGLAAASAAAIHLAVIVAPALVLAVAARKGGVPGWHGADLVAASAVLGSGFAVLVWRRLRTVLRGGDAVADACIAAFNGMVALALTSTLLLIAVLGGFADQHAVLINRGWPVLLLWLVIQSAAIGVSEAVRRGVLRWLG